MKWYFLIYVILGVILGFIPEVISKNIKEGTYEGPLERDKRFRRVSNWLWVFALVIILTVFAPSVNVIKTVDNELKTLDARIEKLEDTLDKISASDGMKAKKDTVLIYKFIEKDGN